MSNHELATSIATIVNVGARVLSSAITAYQAFRKTNVERYFEGLLKASEEGLDLSQIGESEELERLFFSFLDKVAAEANQEKIDAWKNATIHLATDFRDFDYKDNFVQALDSLTALDLTVLTKIYSTDFKKEYFERELTEFLAGRGIPTDIIVQSVKRLASHNLINEHYDRIGYFQGEEQEPLLGSMHYTKNELGIAFTAFVSAIGERTASPASGQSSDSS